MTHNREPIDDYHEGDTLTLKVTVEDEDGDVLPVTNINDIRFLLKDSRHDEATDAHIDMDLADSRVTIVDGQNGRINIKIESGDTDGLSGRKWYKIRMWDSDDEPSTIRTGPFIIQ